MTTRDVIFPPDQALRVATDGLRPFTVESMP